MNQAVTDPMKYAYSLWVQLKRHQPAVAAALAVQLEAVGAEWPQREFFGTRSIPLLLASRPNIAPEYDVLPEIAPFYADDPEECEACLEVGDQCRWHRGYGTGHDELRHWLLQVLKENPAITVAEALEQHAAEADGEGL
ncbi:hypothetical protein [Streptomyces sp. NPDC058657]|uniref:hypothetical protein n=1 Tax=unclassified Streptomyces TaxID=2593676 RepID=UPI00364E6911